MKNALRHLAGVQGKGTLAICDRGSGARKGKFSRMGSRIPLHPDFRLPFGMASQARLDGNKPLHTLRKEAGAMVATRQGIYAASRFLRHSDIQVTAMHYADHKERVVVDISALLEPENVTPISEAEKTKEAICPPLRDVV